MLSDAVSSIRELGGEAVSFPGDVTEVDFGERVVACAVEFWVCIGLMF